MQHALQLAPQSRGNPLRSEKLPVSFVAAPVKIRQRLGFLCRQTLGFHPVNRLKKVSESQWPIGG